MTGSVCGLLFHVQPWPGSSQAVASTITPILHRMISFTLPPLAEFRSCSDLSCGRTLALRRSNSREPACSSRQRERLLETGAGAAAKWAGRVRPGVDPGSCGPVEAGMRVPLPFPDSEMPRKDPSLLFTKCRPEALRRAVPDSSWHYWLHLDAGACPVLGPLLGLSPGSLACGLPLGSWALCSSSTSEPKLAGSGSPGGWLVCSLRRPAIPSSVSRPSGHPYGTLDVDSVSCVWGAA